MRALVLLFLSVAVLGCGEGEVSVDETELESGEDELTASTPIIHFEVGRAPTLTRPMTAGKKVAIYYSPDRLNTCRGEAYGKPAWSITGYWQLNGGEVKSFEAGGFSPSGSTGLPEITVPKAGDLAIWFQVTNRWGCSAWDSNDGSNHHFPVLAVGTRIPEITFKKDYSVAVTNRPAAGKPLVVDYDLARLPSCRQTYNGMATWQITVNYRFDGGPVTSTSVTAVKGMDRVKAPVTLLPPAGTRQVELWFHNTDRAGCSQYDSLYGQNYRFAL